MTTPDAQSENDPVLGGGKSPDPGKMKLSVEASKPTDKSLTKSTTAGATARAGKKKTRPDDGLESEEALALDDGLGPDWVAYGEKAGAVAGIEPGTEFWNEGGLRSKLNILGPAAAGSRSLMDRAGGGLRSAGRKVVAGANRAAETTSDPDPERLPIEFDSDVTTRRFLPGLATSASARRVQQGSMVVVAVAGLLLAGVLVTSDESRLEASLDTTTTTEGIQSTLDPLSLRSGSTPSSDDPSGGIGTTSTEPSTTSEAAEDDSSDTEPPAETSSTAADSDTTEGADSSDTSEPSTSESPTSGNPSTSESPTSGNPSTSESPTSGNPTQPTTTRPSTTGPTTTRSTSATTRRTTSTTEATTASTTGRTTATTRQSTTTTRQTTTTTTEPTTTTTRPTTTTTEPTTTESTTTTTEPTTTTTESTTTTTEPTTTTTEPTTTSEPPCSGSGWNLIMDEQFNGSSINSSRWQVYNSVGNAGHGRRAPSAMSVSGGLLTITASMENGALVSGGMEHRVDQTYGRYEFRVRTDQDPSETMSGVVMTWPQSDVHPRDGENNIYETLATPGDRHEFYTFIHKPYGSVHDQDYTVHSANASSWHTMVMEWTPESIKLYRDGALVKTIAETSADLIPDVAHHATIQLDAWADSLPANVQMQVDYIKVYSYGGC